MTRAKTIEKALRACMLRLVAEASGRRDRDGTLTVLNEAEAALALPVEDATREMTDRWFAQCDACGHRSLLVRRGDPLPEQCAECAHTWRTEGTKIFGFKIVHVVTEITLAAKTSVPTPR